MVYRFHNATMDIPIYGNTREDAVEHLAHLLGAAYWTSTATEVVMSLNGETCITLRITNSLENCY